MVAVIGSAINSWRIQAFLCIRTAMLGTKIRAAVQIEQGELYCELTVGVNHWCMMVIIKFVLSHSHNVVNVYC
jgi:hypothetical protein